LIRSAWLFKRKDTTYGVMGSTALGQINMQLPVDPDVASILAPYIKRF
jgi:hypothetical protein